MQIPLHVPEINPKSFACNQNFNLINLISFKHVNLPLDVEFEFDRLRWLACSGISFAGLRRDSINQGGGGRGAREGVAASAVREEGRPREGRRKEKKEERSRGVFGCRRGGWRRWPAGEPGRRGGVCSRW